HDYPGRSRNSAQTQCRDRTPRHLADTRRSRHLPEPDRRRKLTARLVSAVGSRRSPTDATTDVRTVPDSSTASRSGRWHPFRRRTTTVGHRPCVADQTANTHAGRTLTGPIAHTGRPDV